MAYSKFAADSKHDHNFSIWTAKNSLDDTLISFPGAVGRSHLMLGKNEF